jgi:hypothetical protein
MPSFLLSVRMGVTEGYDQQQTQKASHPDFAHPHPTVAGPVAAACENVEPERSTVEPQIHVLALLVHMHFLHSHVDSATHSTSFTHVHLPGHSLTARNRPVPAMGVVKNI